MWQAIGEKLSDSPNHYIGQVDGNPKITFVQLGLRTISMLLGGINHWSVLLQLSNGQWVCCQFHTNGAVTAHVYNSEREAALRTCPTNGGERVRTSEYGYTDRPLYWSDVVSWLHGRQGGYYVFGAQDCQNFCRNMIDWLTDKWVGWWPIENGVTFYP